MAKRKGYDTLLIAGLGVGALFVLSGGLDKISEKLKEGGFGGDGLGGINLQMPDLLPDINLSGLFEGFDLSGLGGIGTGIGDLFSKGLGMFGESLGMFGEGYANIRNIIDAKINDVKDQVGGAIKEGTVVLNEVALFGTPVAIGSLFGGGLGAIPPAVFEFIGGMRGKQLGERTLARTGSWVQDLMEDIFLLPVGSYLTGLTGRRGQMGIQSTAQARQLLQQYRSGNGGINGLSSTLSPTLFSTGTYGAKLSRTITGAEFLADPRGRTTGLTALAGSPYRSPTAWERTQGFTRRASYLPLNFGR